MIFKIQRSLFSSDRRLKMKKLKTWGDLHKLGYSDDDILDLAIKYLESKEEFEDLINKARRKLKEIEEFGKSIYKQTGKS